jgi:hypothetical protein
MRAEARVRYWHLVDVNFDAEHVDFRGQSGLMASRDDDCGEQFLKLQIKAVASPGFEPTEHLRYLPRLSR